MSLPAARLCVMDSELRVIHLNRLLNSATLSGHQAFLMQSQQLILLYPLDHYLIA